MAYVNPNFRTKKALKDALKEGKSVEVYQHGLGTIPTDGTISLEGPHHPEPHKWYGRGIMKGGKLVEVT